MAGSSVYPGALDNFSNDSPTNLGDNDSTGRTHSERHDDVEASVEAVQSELGLNPSGAFATVDARLDDIEGDVSALDSDVTVLQGDVSTLESDVTVLQGDVVDAAGSVVVLRNELVGFGSVLDPLPPRTPAGESLLKQSVLWLDASESSAGGQEITNLGWGGAALNAQNGSTTGADSNDALFLDWTGLNYVYLPGVASNYLSVPDEAALDITGDIDIRVQVALDDWTPAGEAALASKWNSTSLPNQRGWIFVVLASGRLRLALSSTGTSGVNCDSTVAPTVSDGASLWVRATFRASDGRVQFFTSSDGTSWSQLGTDVSSGLSALFSNTASLDVGSFNAGSGGSAPGKFYRAQVLNGIDGTKVLDVDTSVLTTGAATSFTALTGQTVTINRSTAGRKAVAVTSPCWLFGTDDYMQVADNDLIDFTESEPFTVFAVVRLWDTITSTKVMVAKKYDTGPTYAGWSLRGGGNLSVADGTTERSAAGPISGAGVLRVVAGVQVSNTDRIAYRNGVAGTPQTGALAASAANAYPLRVGRDSFAADYTDMEFIAVAVFRRALTETEITTITNYYSNRIGA